MDKIKNILKRWRPIYTIVRMIYLIVSGYYIKRVWRFIKIIKHLYDVHDHAQSTDEQKRRHLLELSKDFKGGIFVETGTFLGQTTEYLTTHFRQIYTIELSEALYQQAKKRLGKYQCIEQIHGDSATALADILNKIDEPSVFYLDGHYSGGITAKTNKVTPIFEELSYIFNHPIKDHLIIVDDARCFTGLDGYPTIVELHSFVREIVGQNHYKMLVENDRIILTKPGLPPNKWSDFEF